MVFIILQGCFPCSNVSIIRECECTNGAYGSYYDVNIPKTQPHGSIMPIEFSPCATNPCVAAEPWMRPDQVVHHD